MKPLHWPAKRSDDAWKLSPVYDSATSGVPAYPPHLSTRGMFINTPKCLRVGAVLNLHFRLAISDAEVSMRAEVRHVVPRMGFEVEFMDLSPESRTAIEREVDMADPFFTPQVQRKKSA